MSPAQLQVLQARLEKYVDDWGLHDGICDMVLMVGAGESLTESNDPDIIEDQINAWRQTTGAQMLGDALKTMGYRRGWVLVDGTRFPGFVKHPQ